MSNEVLNRYHTHILKPKSKIGISVLAAQSYIYRNRNGPPAAALIPPLPISKSSCCRWRVPAITHPSLFQVCIDVTENATTVVV